MIIEQHCQSDICFDTPFLFCIWYGDGSAKNDGHDVSAKKKSREKELLSPLLQGIRTGSQFGLGIDGRIRFF